MPQLCEKRKNGQCLRGLNLPDRFMLSACASRRPHRLFLFIETSACSRHVNH